MQKPVEREYRFPNCDETKSDFRGECPNCGEDKKIGDEVQKGGEENG